MSWASGTTVNTSEIWNYVHAKTPNYIIRKNGSDYEVIHGLTGVKADTETGLVASIQWAHDQLTGGGDIAIRHDDYYTGKDWEATLTLSNNGISIHSTVIRAGAGLCSFRAADSLDANMITNTGYKNHVYDMCLDGNAANQASGDGILDNSGASGDFHLTNVYVFFAKETGVYWRGGAGQAIGVYVEYPGKKGFRINAASINKFINCWAVWSYTDYGWYLDSATTRNTFVACGSHYNVLAGWVLVDSGIKYNQFIGCYSGYNQTHGWHLSGCLLNIFSGCTSINNSQATTDTYNGVYLNSQGGNHCLRNSMQFIVDSTEAKKHKYGIREEDANQDKNIVASGTVSINSVTGEISLQGAGSLKSADVIEA